MDEFKALCYGVKTKSVMRLCHATYIAQTCAKGHNNEKMDFDFIDDFELKELEGVRSEWVVRNYPPVYKDMLLNNFKFPSKNNEHKAAYLTGLKISKHSDLKYISKEMFEARKSLENETIILEINKLYGTK